MRVLTLVKLLQTCLWSDLASELGLDDGSVFVLVAEFVLALDLLLWQTQGFGFLNWLGPWQGLGVEPIVVLE